MPIFTLQELSEKLNESFEGDGAIQIKGVAPIDSAREGELSFVANPKYVSLISACKASALIAPKDLDTNFRPLIRSANPYLTFTKALTLFHESARRISGGFHPASVLGENIRFGKDVTVMAHAIVEDNAVIGDRTILYPGVFVGRGAVIGEDVTLYPNVAIYPECSIGDRSILHAGCRIGSETESPAPCKSRPVELENDIELGANVAASGAPEAPTRIGEGTKIDNLVQIAAGARIGPHCIIVSQVAIGGFAVLEERVTIAGQVVISPGVTVGARSRIGAKSVVMENVPPDSDYWGIPAQPIHQEMRLKANINRLPKIFDRIRSLEESASES
ncbi:MAG: UDP-3-O-(3-hydroxymyristoyl)glucosamine N-acyltransferase [Candidatus Omnitrophota bacterium]